MVRIDKLVLPRGAVTTAAARIQNYWRQRPRTCWLDSAYDPARLGRFSFLGTDPYATLTVDGETVTYTTHLDGHRRRWTGDPLRALADVAEDVFAVPVPEGFAPPFVGGLVGYIGYDVGVRLASVALQGRRDVVLPDIMFGLYDALVCIDHLDQRLYIVSTGLPYSGGAAAKRADDRLTWLRREVEHALASAPEEMRSVPWRTGGRAANVVHAARAAMPLMRSTFSRDEYVQQVQQVLSLIDAGEVDQVNLSQRLSMPTTVSGPELYQRLRVTSPAPFAGMLKVGDAWVLSSSPERFLCIRDDHIETRPIKGTRPRGKDAVSDARNRAALLASKKDAAEHAMIVDMEREVLERLCRPGTVHVPERMACEQYDTVFHLVSTVAGRLPDGADRVECLRELFPGGSVTGRPKRRAMEIIDQLEPVRRGVYTGAIGYLGVGGKVDLNVAIRTVILHHGWAHFHVGGAVVAGSDPEEEYEETLDKAEGIVRALLSPAS